MSFDLLWSKTAWALLCWSWLLTVSYTRRCILRVPSLICSSHKAVFLLVNSLSNFRSLSFWAYLSSLQEKVRNFKASSRPFWLESPDDAHRHISWPSFLIVIVLQCSSFRCYLISEKRYQMLFLFRKNVIRCCLSLGAVLRLFQPTYGRQTDVCLDLFISQSNESSVFRI